MLKESVKINWIRKTIDLQKHLIKELDRAYWGRGRRGGVIASKEVPQLIRGAKKKAGSDKGGEGGYRQS